MNARSIVILLAMVIVSRQSTCACIWDSDTLDQEKTKSPKMADAILGKPPQLGDPAQLRERIAKLEANRQENDAAWWNDLAGAHLRLGNPTNAASLLEGVVTHFPNDYGIHANLGTAYHLLGRYAEAEKEIARDLEINPDAHFGLEKYHLALLQYLSKDDAYKKAHVYVDEFTHRFLHDKIAWGPLHEPPMYRAKPPMVQIPDLEDSPPPAKKFDPSLATNDYPAYRLKWDLENDTNRENGVLYMASLNPREPACFVMLGIACLEPTDYRSQDLNLAVAAFQKAIELGSPQVEILKRRIDLIKQYIKTAQHAEKRRAELAAPAPAASLSELLVVLAATVAIVVALGWGLTRQSRTP